MRAETPLSRMSWLTMPSGHGTTGTSLPRGGGGEGLALLGSRYFGLMYRNAASGRRLPYHVITQPA